MEAYVYAQLKVPEYLVFDPGGALLHGPIRAWRLASATATSFMLWLPDQHGRLFSAALDLAIEVTQPLLGVRDRDDRPIETAVARARRLEELERRLRQTLTPPSQGD